MENSKVKVETIEVTKYIDDNGNVHGSLEICQAADKRIADRKKYLPLLAAIVTQRFEVGNIQGTIYRPETEEDIEAIWWGFDIVNKMNDSENKDYIALPKVNEWCLIYSEEVYNCRYHEWDTIIHVLDEERLRRFCTGVYDSIKYFLGDVDVKMERPREKSSAASKKS